MKRFSAISGLRARSTPPATGVRINVICREVKRLAAFTAAATPDARRQGGEGLHLAVAQAVPQPLHAAHARRLAAEVKARILKPVAAGTGNRVAQVQKTRPATASA